MSDVKLDSDGFANAKAILAAWLDDNGFDGLCNPEIECGCGVDDFMPCSCGLDCNDCLAAKWHDCIECDKYPHNCDMDCDELGGCYRPERVDEE